MTLTLDSVSGTTGTSSYNSSYWMQGVITLNFTLPDTITAYDGIVYDLYITSNFNGYSRSTSWNADTYSQVESNTVEGETLIEYSVTDGGNDSEQFANSQYLYVNPSGASVYTKHPIIQSCTLNNTLTSCVLTIYYSSYYMYASSSSMCPTISYSISGFISIIGTPGGKETYTKSSSTSYSIETSDVR